MKRTKQIKEAAATGYILLWLLGIPLPILFVIFLLRAAASMKLAEIEVLLIGSILLHDRRFPSLALQHSLGILSGGGYRSYNVDCHDPSD